MAHAPTRHGALISRSLGRASVRFGARRADLATAMMQEFKRLIAEKVRK
jgi:hypothetical protein